MNLQPWLQAARLRTLPLSISGIIVGCALADFQFQNLEFLLEETNYLIFALAILCTVFFQVLSNFANDYGDGLKGTDKNRIGEKRLIASGEIQPKQMKIAIILTATLSFIIAFLLILTSFGQSNWLYSVLFLILGLASIAAAVYYTVGKNAYGYSGFGDLFVFLFFGYLSVLGSYFLYQKSFVFNLLLPATAVGLLSVSVLNLNNMRDQINDKKSNKNTLVVKMGFKKAKIYHCTLIVLALFTSVLFTINQYKNPWQFLFLLSFVPLFLNAIVVIKNQEPSQLDSELKKVALSTFLFAILFALGNTILIN